MVDITPTQPAAKPNRYSANMRESSSNFIPIQKSASHGPPISDESRGSPNPNNNKMYRYNELDSTMTEDITTINDHYDTHNNNNIGGIQGFGGNDLRRLLEQQQMILEQLMKDREGTNHTLKKVESDLSELRHQNQALQRENTILRAESVKVFIN